MGMVAMNITTQLFEAYLHCQTKCWLRSRRETVSGNIYAEWARSHRDAYHKDGLKRAFEMFPETARAINPPISSSKDVTWSFAIDVRLQANELESRLLAVERVPSEGRGRPVQ